MQHASKLQGSWAYLQSNINIDPASNGASRSIILLWNVAHYIGPTLYHFTTEEEDSINPFLMNTKCLRRPKQKANQWRW